MKKTIRGKLYDTDTATALATYSNDLPASDFYYLAETLYRSPNGEYFLHGRGGAATGYAAHYSMAQRGAGENILPISDADMFLWCTDHLPPRKYAAIMGMSARDAETEYNDYFKRLQKNFLGC